MSKTLFLTSAADVSSVPIGHTWQSKPMRIGLWRLILQALISGDWNPIHINPLTAWLYRSNLGGLTSCADLVLAMTKAGFQRMIKFSEQTETIARGYDQTKFDGPINIRTKFYYRFTLKNRKVLSGTAHCAWIFEVLKYKTDEVLYIGVWHSSYKPVAHSLAGQIVLCEHPLVKTARVYAESATTCITLSVGIPLMLSIPVAWWYFKPLNEYCFPLAP